MYVHAGAWCNRKFTLIERHRNGMSPNRFRRCRLLANIFGENSKSFSQGAHPHVVVVISLCRPFDLKCCHILKTSKRKEKQNLFIILG